jgi:peptidoglycan/xylan/chitin deacetylase (PgdA/CDA1 family)
MATGWKRGVERLLVASGGAGALSRRHRPATTILAYHNIVPAGQPLAGDASLHVDQRVFADQLDFLAERYDVVPLADLLRGARERSRVAITFDDAYLGAMSAGLEELRARSLPATVFVPPGLLGADGFWWDLLAPPGGGPLSPDLRRHALETLEGRQDRILDWAAKQGLSRSALPPHARPADETTLVAKAGQEGISLGAHTWSHPNLAAVPSAAVGEELEGSKKWLQARAPRYIAWLAYPYGLRTDAVVARAVESFEGAVLIEGGLAQSRGRWLTSCHAIPRLNVPRGLTLDGLALRLAGLRP